MKIKFIENQTRLSPDLSKLFNIVVNYNNLNDPKKVGYCTSIYDEFFKLYPDGTFDEAVNFYYKRVTSLGGGLGSLIINTHMDKTFSFSLKLIQELDELFTENSKKYIEIYNFLENNGHELISRKYQYKSMLYKTLAIFQNEFDSPKIVLNKIEKWYVKIKSYETSFLKTSAKKYLFDLLTINSMIGVLIQNDILKKMAKRYPNEVFYTNNLFEKEEIDGFINGKRASIKSVNYKNSPYQKVAKKNIENIIGGPIIYYKIKNNEYYIDNEKEVFSFYDIHGENDIVLKEIEQVKHLPV